VINKIIGDMIMVFCTIQKLSGTFQDLLDMVTQLSTAVMHIAWLPTAGNRSEISNKLV